jgi:hypothetical protein
MSTTKTFKSGETTLTIQRPSYRAFRDIAAKVEALLDVDPAAAVAVPEFEEVLKATQQDVEAFEAWIEQADYQEVVRLWDETVEHCEFIPFFEARRKQHSERSKAKMLDEIDLMAAQMERAKSSGLLPSDFSISDAMTEAMRTGENPMMMPSFSTSTPADTGGDEPTSKAKTSGGSSGTSRKRSGGGKRSSN